MAAASLAEADLGMHGPVGGSGVQLQVGAGKKALAQHRAWVSLAVDECAAGAFHTSAETPGHEAVDDRVDAGVDKW